MLFNDTFLISICSICDTKESEQSNLVDVVQWHYNGNRRFVFMSHSSPGIITGPPRWRLARCTTDSPFDWLGRIICFSLTSHKCELLKERRAGQVDILVFHKFLVTTFVTRARFYEIWTFQIWFSPSFHLFQNIKAVLPSRVQKLHNEISRNQSRSLI